MASGHSIVETGISADVDSGSEDLTLAELAARLWAGKFWIIAGAIGGLAAAVLYLNSVTFAYTASMKVTAAPSSQSSAPRSGSLGGLAALAGVSLNAAASGASPFEIYLETLSSENVARRLANDAKIMHTVFAKDWDASRRRWREPERGIVSRMLRGSKQALGIPVKSWRRPDARELADFLGEEISIQRDARSPIVGVMLNHPDPQFAMQLLSDVSRQTDRLIRESVLTRSRSYADYLERKLPTVTIAEQREALVQALSEQEKSIMMASSTVPFAATVVSGPVVSALPTKPNAMVVVLALLIVGLIFGASVALIGRKPARA